MPAEGQQEARPGRVNWSDGEIEVAVEAYLVMLRQEQAGEALNKAAVRRRTLEGGLSARGSHAFEYRMQNISSVLSEGGYSSVQGYVPRRHAGSGVARRIRAALAKLGGFDFSDTEPTDDDATLAERSLRLRRRGAAAELPPGNRRPKRKSGSATSYERDPRVHAYVLHQARGRCELCMQPAPFVDATGEPFLEVHHVRPLAAEGSDTPSNAAAICPNCHRRCHHALDRAEASRTLLANVKRLIAE
jgi:5-methylcytosine-specific restriction protein A